MHAATFGGNPIAARAGIATIEAVEKHGYLARTKELGEMFLRELMPLVKELSLVTDVRGCGLMIGVELQVDGTPIVQQCLDRGLLINCTQQTVIRLLPAMTLTDEQLQEGCEILAAAVRNFQP